MMNNFGNTGKLMNVMFFWSVFALLLLPSGRNVCLLFSSPKTVGGAVAFQAKGTISG